MGKSKTVAAALIFATLVVVSASSKLTDEIQASCSTECTKEHKDPADSKQCVDFCSFSSKYLIVAYAAAETDTTKKVGKFTTACTEGCPKEYKDPATATKCVDFCNVVAKELEGTLAKEKMA
jgi:hypothetical protein